MVNAEGRLTRGIGGKDFENLSITTKIAVLPLDSGRFVRKSMAIWDHGRWGVGSGRNFPVGRVLGTLACAQVEHDDTTR